MTGDTLARRWQSHNRWNIYPAGWVMLPVTSCDEMWGVERASDSQSQLCEGYKHTIWQKRNILAGNKWHVCLSVFTLELFSFLKKNHIQKPWAFGPGGPHDRLRLMTPHFSLFFWVSFQLPFSPFLCLPHTEKRIFGYYDHFNFCGILLTTLTPTPSSFLAVYPPLMLLF